MDIDCPKCEKNIEFDCDDLPDNACDDTEHKCVFCQYVFSVGWCAVAELR